MSADRPVSSNRKTVPTFFGRLYGDTLPMGGTAGTWVRRAEVDALLDAIELLQQNCAAYVASIQAHEHDEEQLRATLTKLTNGYKYSTEVVTIAREGLSGNSPTAPARHSQHCDCHDCHYSRKHPQIPHHALCGCWSCTWPADETSAHLGWAEEERKCLLRYHEFHGRQMPDPAGASHRARAEQLRIHDQGSQSGEIEPRNSTPGSAAPITGTSAVDARTQETSKDVTPEFAAEFEREIVRKVLKDVEGLTEGRSELFWAGMSMACEEATYRLEEIWKGLPTSAGSSQETSESPLEYAGVSVCVNDPSLHLWNVRGRLGNPLPEQLCENGCGLMWKNRASENGKGDV